jgi:tetratricopeptide (TPR) repeat protein/DNA-binding XRE family transcriptional regulator
MFVGSQQPRGPRTGIDIDPAVMRQARREAGLSLAEVAGSELSRQAVHLIEAGKVRPTARSLRLIANRLGVPQSALLAPPGPRSDRQVISDLERLSQRQEHPLVAEQACRLIELGGSPERTAYAHHYAGRALYQLAQPAEAVAHLRQARERFEALGNPWWAAESLDWEAIALNMLEDPSALRVGRRALRRYRALEPRRPETEARMLEHVGSICYGRRDYEGGRASYEAALQVEGGVRELARIARVYHGLGMCHHGLRELGTAAELVFKAVTLYEAEQRITPAPMRMDMPRAENDLGMVMMGRGELERAEQLFRAALDHYAAAGIERLQSHTLLSMGELREKQGRLDEAVTFVIEAIERAAAWNEMYSLTSGYRQLGELYAVRGDHHLADAAFQRALALLQETGLEERAADCMRAYERVLFERREARRRARSETA